VRLGDPADEEELSSGVDGNPSEASFSSSSSGEPSPAATKAEDARRGRALADLMECARGIEGLLDPAEAVPSASSSKATGAESPAEAFRWLVGAESEDRAGAVTDCDSSDGDVAVAAAPHPCSVHDDPRVREGFAVIQALDRELREKDRARASAARGHLNPDREKDIQHAAEDQVRKARRRERRDRRLRAILEEREVTTLNAAGTSAGVDGASVVSASVVSLLRRGGGGAASSRLAPAEEEAVERLVALDEDEIEEYLANPFDLGPTVANAADDADDGVPASCTLIDLDRRLAAFARPDRAPVSGTAPTPDTEERIDAALGEVRAASLRGDPVANLATVLPALIAEAQRDAARDAAE